MFFRKRHPDQPKGANIFQKLTHGFTASIMEGCDCHTNYIDSRGGVDIKVEGLYKSFGAKPVLKDINLDIHAGETFCIIGPSGTGKSVLLKHLVRLEQPDAGRILIDGQDIFAPDYLSRGRDYRYSMVFQTSALFNSLTVGENVGLWLRENRVCPEKKIQSIIHEKLELVNLSGTQDMRTSQLSGGMKKRVAIARSLAMNPDLILYDEPTAELDPVTSDELARVIQSLKSEVKLTTIIVSHDLNFSFYLADRVAMINKGEIIEVGTPAEIKASSNETIRNFIYTTTKGINGG